MGKKVEKQWREGDYHMRHTTTYDDRGTCREVLERQKDSYSAGVAEAFGFDGSWEKVKDVTTRVTED